MIFIRILTLTIPSFSLDNRYDNNNCSDAHRTLSQRIFAAIVIGRMYQDQEVLAQDLNVLKNFCEKGDLCCLYDEHPVTNHLRVTNNMSNQTIIQRIASLTRLSRIE